MRLLACSGLLTPLSGCVVAPSYQYVEGGERVYQPGVSFVLPEGKSWSAIMRSTYQADFGANEMPKYETLITSAWVYNIASFSSKQEFLKCVKKGRVSSEPETGRFEVIRNNEKLSETRTETCVVHQSASKDCGAQAKRGGVYTILETFGMNCIHPYKPSVGIFVELSRKAPPGTNFPEFNAMASALLQSVSFGAF